MNSRNNRKIAIFALIAAICATTVAYAVLQTTLNISGTVTKKGGTWDIHFTNVANVTKLGDATMETPEISGGTTVTFEPTLEKPLDAISFTVDVINEGDINAELTNISLTGVTEAKAQDITYTVTYSDGKEIKVGDLLEKDAIKTLKIEVKFDNVTSIPESNVILDLGLSLTYTQTDNENASLDGDLTKVCTATKGTGLNVGDEITCGTESFYVMSSDDTTITMMAKHNLNVGNDKAEGAEGIQNYQCYYQGVYKCGISFDDDSNVYEGSLAEGHVNNYLTYLTGTVGLNAATTATLPSTSELEAFSGCQFDGSIWDPTGMGGCGLPESKIFINNTVYWTRTAKSTDEVYYMYEGFTTWKSYSDVDLTGIRPVVTILKTEI